MQVVIAEKPSVARDIAAVIGAKTKNDGYFEGAGYAVTYAFGHLVRIAEPEDMDEDWGKPWRLDVLPMVPDEWKYCVDAKAKQQFNVIKKLLLDDKTTRVICATDAGREGEHIFRLIYRLSGCKKPVSRLWISSLTSEAIKDGFAKLRSGSEFNNLARAAAARAHADWLVGLNFTRAYTLVSKQLCTIGRVQTPTLALLVERQKQIDNFRPTPFFEIVATMEPGFQARYISQEKEGESSRLADRSKAETIFQAVKGSNTATVFSIETSEKKSKAPGLYDLLSLQKEANKRFGFTAQQTLDLAQSLYEEHKLLSYPRTESRHISTDMVNELPRTLNSLLQNASQEVTDVFDKEGLQAGKITVADLAPRLSKAYVDDTKLTDHHAIIPTGKKALADLPEKERKIYELVLTRFLSIFLPAERREETTVLLSIAGHTFRARGIVIRDPGWTILEPKSEDKEDGEEVQQLPAVSKGDQLRKTKEELKEGKTSPPKAFDDASLLTAMKNAGQEIDDEELASHMKQSGLGTPATRAAIIERLLQSGYVERQKKALVPTDKGKGLIEHVHEELKDVKLTASWEQELSEMQEGKVSAAEFEERIIELVERLLPEVIEHGASLADAVKVEAESFGRCPQCKKGEVRKTPKGAGCNRWKDGCKFSVWQEQFGKKLTDKQLEDLLNGETKKIKGFKKKDGSGTFEAKLFLDKDFKVRLSFD